MRLIPHCLFAILFIFFIWTGLTGIDFGRHWDEGRLFDSVEQSRKTGLFVPRWYNNPSLVYDICLLTASSDHSVSSPPVDNNGMGKNLSPEEKTEQSDTDLSSDKKSSIPEKETTSQIPPAPTVSGIVSPLTAGEVSSSSSSAVSPGVIETLQIEPPVIEEPSFSPPIPKTNLVPVDVTEPADFLDSEGAVPSRHIPEEKKIVKPTVSAVLLSKPANHIAKASDSTVVKAKLSETKKPEASSVITAGNPPQDLVIDHSPLFRVRGIFLFLSSLSLLWVYLMVGFWRNNWNTALFSAAFLGLSWEMAYHARWIAPEGILLQFAALTMMLALTSYLLSTPLSYARIWLFCTAAAAGLACGTKYQGAALLLPVLCTAAVLPRPHFSVKPLPLYLPLVGIFAGVFVLTTPGIIAEPANVLRALFIEIFGGKNENMGHLVKPGLEHYALMISYISRVLLSPFQSVSLLFFLLLIVGGWAVCIQDIKIALIFLCFPIFYFLFIGLQKTMLVRDVLVLLPFFAVLCALGVEYLLKISRVLKFCQYGIIGILTLCLLANAGWMGYAALTITSRAEINYDSFLDRYITKRPNQKFVLSPLVSQKLTTSLPKTYENVVQEIRFGVKVIFFSSEAKVMKSQWPANHAGRYQLLGSGPYEINFDYYPDWIGDDRIVIVDNNTARLLGF